MGNLPDPQAERLLRLATEEASDHAFILLDLTRNVTWWSRGAEEIFGYTPSEIVGQSVSLLFTPEDIASGMPQYEVEVALRDGPGEDDRWMQRRDGSRFWASGILVAVRDAAGELLGFAKILRNRTDLKEQLEALRNFGRELEAAGRQRDVFFGTLAHELRNPLGSISNALAIVGKHLPQPSREVEFALKVIDRQMQLLGRLVEDLMDLTRVGEGKVVLRLEPVLLQTLVSDVAGDTEQRLRQRGQSLAMLFAEGPIHVNADRDRLRQVILNLVVNASKYTPEGGHISLKVTTEGNEALIKVEDDGVGISAEMLPKIFELFTQVESSRVSSQGGLGIGLALVKSLVSLHGGTVQARSDGLGKGAEFAVRLPRMHPPG